MVVKAKCSLYPSRSISRNGVVGGWRHRLVKACVPGSGAGLTHHAIVTVGMGSKGERAEAMDALAVDNHSDRIGPPLFLVAKGLR